MIPFVCWLPKARDQLQFHHYSDNVISTNSNLALADDSDVESNDNEDEDVKQFLDDSSAEDSNDESPDVIENNNVSKSQHAPDTNSSSDSSDSNSAENDNNGYESDDEKEEEEEEDADADESPGSDSDLESDEITRDIDNIMEGYDDDDEEDEHTHASEMNFLFRIGGMAAIEGTTPDPFMTRASPGANANAIQEPAWKRRKLSPTRWRKQNQQKNNRNYDGSDSELDDIQIKESDEIFITLETDESHEIHTLQMHVFDTVLRTYYVHHCINLSSFPLCCQPMLLPLPAQPTSSANSTAVQPAYLNLIAVGGMNESIEIFNLDAMDVLEPLFALGGRAKPEHGELSMDLLTDLNEFSTFDVNTFDYHGDDDDEHDERGDHGDNDNNNNTEQKQQQKQKKRKKKKKNTIDKNRGRILQETKDLILGKLQPDSHQSSILCLEWNAENPWILISGSADSTIKIWNLKSMECEYTLTHVHRDKIQAMKVHPTEKNILLTSSFDETVVMCDLSQLLLMDGRSGNKHHHHKTCSKTIVVHKTANANHQTKHPKKKKKKKKKKNETETEAPLEIDEQQIIQTKVWNLNTFFEDEDEDENDDDLNHNHHNDNISCAAESIEWHPTNHALFIASLNNGFIVCVDTRAPKDCSLLWKMRAHSKAVTCLSFNHKYPELLVSGSIDKTVKLWHFAADGTQEGTHAMDDATPVHMKEKPRLLATQRSQIGSVFSCRFAPTKYIPSIIVFGGQSNLAIWDIMSCTAVRDLYHISKFKNEKQLQTVDVTQHKFMEHQQTQNTTQN